MSSLSIPSGRESGQVEGVSAGEKGEGLPQASLERRPFPVAPVILGAIMLGGLLVRLPFWVGSAPSLGWPLVLDEGNYVGIAEPLSRGEGIVDKWAWMRPPGYPAYISLFLIAGLDLTAAALVQVLLSVATLGALYALAVEALHHHGRVALGRAQAAGLFGAGLLALNPHAAYYADLLMPETLYMLVVTVMAWALMRGVRIWRGVSSPTRLSLSMIGLGALMASAAIYLRSTLQAFVPFTLGWLLWVLPRQNGEEGSLLARVRGKLRRRAWLAPLLFLGVMFLAIAPWTLRNYLTYDRFMLMDAVGGLNLWQYNGGLSRAEVLARMNEIPNPVDRDRYATQQAVEAILTEPLRFAGDAASRFVDSWPVEYYSELWVGLRNKYPGIDCTLLDVFSWLSTLFYVPFGVLVIWGVTFAPGRTFKAFFLLFLAHYALTTMLAHNEFRYRLPLYPYASVFAGWSLLLLGESLRRGGIRRSGRGNPTAEQDQAKRHIPKAGLAIGGLITLLFIVQCAAIASPGLARSLPFERRYLEGKSHLARAMSQPASEGARVEYAAALESFLGAAEIERGCACLYRQIGLAQGGLGMRDDERTSYITALQREEYDWRTAALLSDRLRLAGSPDAPAPIRATRPEYRSIQQEWAWEQIEPPPLSSLDVGGADIGYLKGWHALEAEGETTYRWSRERSWVRLNVPEGEGSVQLSMRAHSLAWPGKAEPDALVRVSVDGRELGVVRLGPGWEEATLDLGLLETNRQVVIELVTSVATPPGDEIRSLGFALDQLWMSRVKR
jgi:hypothetical protein